MTLSAEIMTKGAFAAHIGVSAGRISQYIAEGKIYGEALEGDGRSAKIRPAIARQQLQKTLEPSQRFGVNGVAVLKSAAQPALQLAQSDGASAPPPRLTFTDDVADQLAAERLRQQQITTARLEREEALEVGRYMRTDDARRQTVRAVSEAFKVMEQGIPEMAKAIAAQFGVPMHDATHALLKAFREVRAKKAAAFRSSADELPEHIEDEQP